jgi:hypothetical protein
VAFSASRQWIYPLEMDMEMEMEMEMEIGRGIRICIKRLKSLADETPQIGAFWLDALHYEYGLEAEFEDRRDVSESLANEYQRILKGP